MSRTLTNGSRGSIFRFAKKINLPKAGSPYFDSLLSGKYFAGTGLGKMALRKLMKIDLPPLLAKSVDILPARTDFDLEIQCRLAKVVQAKSQYNNQPYYLSKIQIVQGGRPYYLIWRLIEIRE